jgi:CDP-glycerol glycerophosphotransferase (TagB/SpsB family)
VTQTGYFPFLNFPESSTEKRKEHLESVGLDAARKNVVYLPRGKPNGSFDLMMPNFLRDMPEVNFIVRPHPSQSVKLHLRDRLLFLSMQKQIKQHKNVFLDLNHFRLSDLLSMADLVITDGNSPAEESLFYDTPQMLVENERLSRKSISNTMRKNAASEEDVELALRIYDNGPIITPANTDLCALIERAMADASQYAKARKANFEFVFGERDFKRQHALIDELRSFA